ncbi:hypothetical protein BON22_2400 [Cyberlindnera fabianii]|uniref:Alpha-1,3-mannosyltransferase MNN1 n=1 Tax=Cyberlindnera fabianii TaxID=36022 RepID=A0A1V2L668_CYBFA|nr:hypothetical protein BON22_2400 [Cyberlindnera fabianii]
MVIRHCPSQTPTWSNYPDYLFSPKQMTLSNRVRLHLARWDQKLSHLRLYKLLRAQPRLLVLTTLCCLIVVFFASLPGSYIDAATSHINQLGVNTTALEGFSGYDALHDFFDGESAVVPEASKFVFINNKYPTPKVYSEILKEKTPEEFVAMPMDQRCQMYFEKLYQTDPDWTIHDLESGYPYNGYIFDTKDRFFEDRLNDFKKELEKEGITDEETINKLVEERNMKYQWENTYAKARQESYDSETAMSNWATHLRVFSQCYLEETMNSEQQARVNSFDEKLTCQEHEKRLFKFLTMRLPKYVRWNSEELHELPKIQNYIDNVTYTTEPTAQPGLCFMRELKNAYNGKGIAITAADKHVGELSSLILVLRAINNTLPIQIIHRGDLSEESQKALTLVSRSTSLHLERIPSFQKYIQTYFQDVRDLDIETIFPPQEIWYVDISDAVSPDDKRFITYGNKLLTLLFASFEDTVVIDTDTVPFVDITKYILESSVYKDLGAFFFKDRMLYDRMTGPEMTYFYKLLPTRLDSAFFDIPELTNHTLNNRFFGEKYKHVQESGMVAINKKRHIRSTLFINILQMWHATTTRVHGDKELFWLGFSIAGDEDYYMNKYGVGAVGSLNPNSNRLLGDETDERRSKLRSHMLCTTHPAHLSGLDDHTLLWMNSGFITCKRENEAENDIKMDLYKNIFASAEKLKETYVGPLKIEAVLVPPPQERVINNDLGEPSSGWDVMFGCGGYLYCAYDRIGGSDDPFYMGTLVEYDDKQIVLYDYLGEIWVYYDKVIRD